MTTLLRSGYERDKIAKAAAKAAALLLGTPANVPQLLPTDEWPSVSGWFRLQETFQCCVGPTHLVYPGEVAYLTAPTNGHGGFQVYCIQHRPADVSPP